MSLAYLLAFASGFIALSHEILWYRVYSYASQGAADAFALMLGAYLAGIAFGAYAARALCRDGTLPLRAVAWLLAGSCLAYLVPPAIAGALTLVESWELTLPATALAAALLGAVFPLVGHAFIAPDARSGSRVSFLYVANILGSVAGSLGTGFVLLDRWPLATVAWLLACASLACAAALTAARGVRGMTLAATVALCVLGAAALQALGPALYGSLYEKLQFQSGYRPGERFALTIENKSGVIAVGREGTVYGGGTFDGTVNTTLYNDTNAIVRAYVLAGMHAAPREVFMVGLSSGSWANVIADHPRVERLTIVEINPGYLKLLEHYPEVAGLLKHPKVHIEIDDARRWLVRHAERRFDLIISNNTLHWRAHMSNLLSVEFTELVRSRLRPGGVYYFNATASARAVGTAAAVFPHLVAFHNCVAASSAPLAFDRGLWAQVMRDYVVAGHSPLGGRISEQSVLDRIDRLLVPGPALRARIANVALITDDNMGSEW
ncbi:MAG TPA: fused MFS/spermidine synthase [Burkholderiales bacterium]|jgi:spermidine synthase|nr:fused MFS/spermidine synthase [Burkholderiales bacterium]